jgi:ribose/xylose/arabinose/galactoside ABC-type transport system permease subunit
MMPPGFWQKAEDPMPLRLNGFHLAFLALIIANAALSPAFLTFFNLQVVLASAAPLLILATGATLVILTGRIDISGGSVMFLAGGLFVVLQEIGAPQPVAILAALAAGALIGALNGAMVAWAGLSALLATLGTMLIVRGLGLNVIGGKQHALPPAAETLRDAEAFGFPAYVLLALAVTVAAQLLLSRTLAGRRLIALGSAERAAVKLGIPVRAYTAAAFTLAGALAALAGIVSTLNLGGVQTYLGKGEEFVAIAAAVVGGVSLFGGRGSLVPGVFLGVLFLVIIENALNLAGVSPFAFPFVTGLLILLAMAAYGWSAGLRRPLQTGA